MTPFDKAPELAYSSDPHRRAKCANANPKRTKSLRSGEIQHLRKISAHFLPSRQRLVRKLESKAPARGLNIPLIVLLTQQLGYADKALPRDLVYGMGIVGEIETTNSIAPRNTPATTNLGHMECSLRIRNGSGIKSLSNARGPILKNKRRGRSMGGFRKGWLSELNPVTNSDRRDDGIFPSVLHRGTTRLARTEISIGR